MDQLLIEHTIDLCYEAVASPDAWRDALNAMSKALNAAAIMFYPKSLGLNTGPLPTSEAYDDFLPDFLADGWHNNHYRAERGWQLLKKSDTAVVIEHQLATDDERKVLPHYNDLYLKKGYPGFAAIGFNVGGEQWAMCVLRNFKQGFFTPEDADRMLPLAEHFRRIVRLAERFETSCLSTSLSALGDQGHAAAVLTKEGRILAMNVACERMLKSSPDGLIVRNGRFQAVAIASNHALQALIHAMTNAGHSQRREAHKVEAVIARPDRLPLLVEGLCISALGLEHSLHAHAVLIFADPQTEPQSREMRYRAAFRLTPAEANFAALLVCGRALNDAADVQSITRETARQRLKLIFAKTGTHRQGELVSLLSRLG